MRGAAARYSLYGLGVESTIPLQCLHSSPHVAVDVRIQQGSAVHFERARRCVDGSRAAWFQCGTPSARALYLRWSGLFEFLIDRETHTIRYRQLERASKESFNAYLLGQVLSFPLLSLGREPLHATAVVIDGRAVAFLGDCGSGKSTLAAAFVARGYTLLTDDLLTLVCRDGTWLAYPGPARIKLYPRVAARYLPDAAGRSPLTPHTRKLVVALGQENSERRPMPLEALYVLPQSGTRAGGPNRTRVTTLSPERAFLTLVRSAFNLIQVDRARLENQFRVLTQVARDVPVRRLGYRRRLAILDKVCETIIRQTVRS